VSQRGLRILIVDDHEVVREGLRALLDRQPDMEVVGEAPDGPTALARYETCRPDVTLMDLRIPGMSGLEAIRALRERHPHSRIIAFTTFDLPEEIHDVLRAGAQGYLLKASPGNELLAAIRNVHAGRRVVPAAVAERLAERLTALALTPREKEILGLMVEGLGNLDIGARLGLTEGTIKGYVNVLFRKLGVKARTQATRVALEQGLVRSIRR
jgi:DNA-binding NarL/FixJ family response regulator